MSQNKPVEGRLSCRVAEADLQRLRDWANTQADIAGVPREAMGYSSAVRMAIRAFLDGKTRTVATDEGYAQGLRIAYNETRIAMARGLSGSLAGLHGVATSAEEKKE